MKIRSLLLGSVAAAGLSTGAFAADLGVLTSLDVCDALGLSGLTISSDTNCLQITGGVSYEFRYGDYAGDNTPGGNENVNRVIGRVPGAFYGNGRIENPLAGNYNATPALSQDWRSVSEAWLKLVASADSDFGRAQAIIVLKQTERIEVVNEREGVAGADGLWGTADDSYIHGDTTNGVILDEAYVRIGDSTVILAGKRKGDARGSIGNFGDDNPYNFTGLVNSNKTEHGVLIANDSGLFGGHSIQVQSDLGNGVSVGVGLEKIEGYTSAAYGPIAARTVGQNAGTLVGTIGYAGDGITAHATGWALGVLDANVDGYGFHAGATAVIDQISVRGAAAYAYDVASATHLFEALASAKAEFDIFTLALSGEVTNTNAALPGGAGTGYGVGGSIGADVTDGVAINLGGKWFRNANGEDIAHGAAQIVASVTETVKLTGEVGVWYGSVAAPAPDTVYYGLAKVDWAPGGGFTSSLQGEVHSNGAYRAIFKAAKEFN